MKHFAPLLFAPLLLLFSACDNDSGPKPQGTEGDPCYPNGTCDSGLVCQLDVCVNPGLNNTSNNTTTTTTNNTNNTTTTSATTNNTNVQDGEEGGACLPDNLCNAGLLCHNDICYPDADNDGYPSVADCDDSDEQVQPGSVKTCSSQCDDGTQMCRDDGTWTDCSADTNCDCDEPGSIREHECGNCGWGYQHCSVNYEWGQVDECLDQGECRPGQEEERVCGNCGSQERLCTPACEWNPWTSCVGEGECSPGTAEWTTDDCTPIGTVHVITCDNTCTWVNDPVCTFDCPGTPRAGGTLPSGDPDFKEEICIPGGPFLMGHPTGDFAVQTIYLSPYYIDKYEVTNNRYRECENAGVCTYPSGYDDSYSAPNEGSRPMVGVSFDQASQFCQWDGGRVLPTSAQWTKAAKGPYPEQKLYPWGDTPAATDCNYSNSEDCGYFNVTQDVDALPLGVSYYGVYSLGGNVTELTVDTYDLQAFNSLDTLDPIITTGQVDRVITKGSCIYSSELDQMYLDFNGWARVSSIGSNGYGFRCIRSAN